MSVCDLWDGVGVRKDEREHEGVRSCEPEQVRDARMYQNTDDQKTTKTEPKEI